MLNIKPNNFTVGYDFWKAAIVKLLDSGECLIVPQNQKLYIADSFSVTNSVLVQKKYSDIHISDGTTSVILKKTYKAEDVIHLKYDNKKIRDYLKLVIREYNKILSAISAGNQTKAIPKYVLTTTSQVPLLKTKLADSTEKELTVDELVRNINGILKSESAQILRLPDSLKLSEIKSAAETSVNDMTSTAKEIFVTCAIAFDIPQSLLLGTIPEDSNAINEYMTFAVKPIVKVLQDSLNDTLVGMEDYLLGERIVVDLSNYKHIDIIDVAANLDKLRSNGWTLNEIRELCGLPPLSDKFANQRVLTKNYGSEGGEG